MLMIGSSLSGTVIVSFRAASAAGAGMSLDERLDLVFYGIHVDVTDHDDRLIIGAVPLVVEVLQLLVVEALQSVEVADQVAVLVFCVLTGAPEASSWSNATTRRRGCAAPP